jgi:hypothetical protein
LHSFVHGKKMAEASQRMRKAAALSVRGVGGGSRSGGGGSGKRIRDEDDIDMFDDDNEAPVNYGHHNFPTADGGGPDGTGMGESEEGKRIRVLKKKPKSRNNTRAAEPGADDEGASVLPQLEADTSIPDDLPEGVDHEQYNEEDSGGLARPEMKSSLPRQRRRIADEDDDDDTEEKSDESPRGNIGAALGEDDEPTEADRRARDAINAAASADRNNAEARQESGLRADQVDSMRAGLVGPDEDKKDDDADENYVPVCPPGWGPPDISVLPVQHQLYERRAMARRPMFCAFCEFTRKAHESKVGGPSGVYKKHLDWMMATIHQLSTTAMCLKLQERFFSSMLSLIQDEDARGTGPVGGPVAPRAIVAVHTRAKPTWVDRSERAGKYYWCLKCIFEHFTEHAPNERFIYERVIRGVMLRHEAMMKSSWYLRNPINRRVKYDYKAMKMMQSDEDRLVKWSLHGSQIRPKEYY